MNAAADLYDAPAAPAADAATADPTTLRRAHLRHEAALIGLGKLRVIIGLYLIFTSSTFSLLPQGEPELGALLFVLSLAIWALGVFDVVVGVTLWTLRPAARTLTALRAIFQVFNVPVGTLVGVYSLWLTQSQGGALVLSPAYAAVRAKTPALKPPTTLFGVIALLLCVPTAFMYFTAVFVRICVMLGVDSP